MSSAKYRGEMGREEALERLKKLARRLGLEPGDIKVRPSGEGMRLSFSYKGVELVRECSSQGDRERDFVCLVLWLSDLVRNVERRIETVAEAFYSEGGRLLPASSGAYGETAENLYDGEKTAEESFDLIRRSLERLGLSEDDVRVTWDTEQNVARLRLRLRSGAIVDKTSQGQRDALKNLATLALWLKDRAKNVERGIERDLDRLFAANLLPAASAA